MSAVHGVYTLQNVNHLFEFRDEDYYIIMREAEIADADGNFTVDLSGVVKDGATVYYEVLNKTTVGTATAYTLSGDAEPAADPSGTTVGVKIYVRFDDLKSVGIE